MSIIPDYAIQATELMRQLEGQADHTAQYWTDKKQQDYYVKYVTPYLENLEAFVHGGNIRGKGLNELLEFLSEKIDEFESVGEVSISSDIMAPAIASAGSAEGQFMVAPSSTESEIADITGAVSTDVHTEMQPEEMTERRAEWTVDYNLNSPGNFSAQNLRQILKKRKNG